jgi:tRNA threonylcarbamoyladenosine biosynthesis protein TsaE
MSVSFSVTTSSESELEAVAAGCVRQMRAPSMWLLFGNLGAGKTTWVRGFVHALDANIRVLSPTYGLVRTYPTTPAVVHVDLYRYADAPTSTVTELGIEDSCGRSDAHVLIEWPSPLCAQWAPPNAPIIEVHIEVPPHDPNLRTLVARQR